MTNLTIIAHIHAAPDQIAAVKAELIKLVVPTRAEQGCLVYDLHQDRKDPTHFFFYETWTSPDALSAHMSAPHIATFRAAVKGMITKSDIFELDRVT